MKRFLIIVTLSLIPLYAFPRPPATRLQSGGIKQRHLDVRVKPFVDLFFFVYRLAASSEKPPAIDGLEQAVEAARGAPFFAMVTESNQILFRSETAAEAVKAFSEFPETYRTRKGEIIPLRERAVRLAKSLAVIEKPFRQTLWPQHKVALDQAAKQISQTLGPREHESFAYLTKSLGMEDVQRVVPVYLVAEAGWPGAFTIWGEDRNGLCVISVATSQGSSLLDATLHEAIHALDLETKEKGNVLTQLRDRLLKAGFAEDDLIVRHAPHMLVFIQSAETVRRYLDSTYQPYAGGVFAREPLQPIVKVELPIWTAYLNGKLSRDDAVTQIVEELVKARGRDTPAKGRP